MCIWDNVTFLYIILQLFKMLQKVWNSLNKNKQHSDFIYGNPLHHFHYNSSDCFFVTSFWQISASPRQLHIKLQATLAEAHEHRLVLQWLDVLSHISPYSGPHLEPQQWYHVNRWVQVLCLVHLFSSRIELDTLLGDQLTL